MAETGMRKHKAGILFYWRHLEPERICFLFQQNGNWEAGTTFNIHQDTKYCTLTPYAAFSLFLKISILRGNHLKFERGFQAGGEGKELKGT